MKTILIIFCLFLCLPSYATYVCSREDAVREALDKWGGEVIEAFYDADRRGYHVIMKPRTPRSRSFFDILLGRGKNVRRFIPFDC